MIAGQRRQKSSCRAHEIAPVRAACAIEIALGDVAAEFAEQPQLLVGLDAFGGDGQAKPMGQVDDRF